MTNDIVLTMFVNSPWANELAAFFRAIYKLTDSNFISLDSEVDTSASDILVNQILKEIHAEYKGQLTDRKMQVGAFISSLYQLPDLDTDSPSKEWLFISKLCHLLFYSHIHSLPNRVKDICFIGRAWFKPNSANDALLRLVFELQDDNLKTMYYQFQAETDKLKRTKNSMYNSIIKVYRILDYVYNNRHRIRRRKTERKTRKPKIDQPYSAGTPVSNMDDSVDELISHIHFDSTENNIDITRERLDDNTPDYLLLNQKSIELPEKYTPSQIYRRTKSKLQHANKNERFITVNTRTLPLFIIQDVFAAAWQKFISNKHNREEKTAYAYILLSLLSGYPISMLMSDLYKRKRQIVIIDLQDQSYELIVKLDITPLRLKTAAIKKVIANQSMDMRIALPFEIGTFFTFKAQVNDKTITDAINSIQTELKLPYLSKARIENALYTLMVRHINSSQIANIITSVSEKKRADVWYSSHTVTEMISCYTKAIQLLTDKTPNFNTDYITKSNHANNPGIRIGSQNSPDYPLVEAFFGHLHKQVMTSRDFVDRFNSYTLWMWHICLLLTSIRAVEAAPGYLNQFNLKAGLGWISDKEERATASSQRYVPLCDFLVQEIKNYLAYLKRLQKQYKWLSVESNIAKLVDEVLLSQRPLLNVITKQGGFEVMRPALARYFINQHFKFKEDWTRHVGQRYLHEKNMPESLILSVFGHESMGQESWRKHSSLSIGDLLTLKPVYQQLTIDLDLQPVRFNK